MKKLGLLIILLSLFLISCVEQPDPLLLEEYYTYKNQIKKDIGELNEASSDTPGSDVTTILNKLERHLKSFKEFVQANKEGLSLYGINVVNELIDVDDVLAIIEERRRAFKESIILDKLLGDFNNHVKTFNDDISRMNNIMTGYNQYISSNEVGGLTQSANDYADYYSVMQNHLDSFETFLNENEEELKDAGEDIYTWQKSIQDSRATVENRIKGMQKTIQDIYASQQALEEQEQQGLQALLRLFTMLI